MGGKVIGTRPDGELRERFDRFMEDFDYDEKSQASRKLLDEGLRSFGYHPGGGSPSSVQAGLQGAGCVLVLFSLGLFGFGAFAPATITVLTNPAAFLMLVAGGGFLFISTLLQAARENRLPGIRRARQIRG